MRLLRSETSGCTLPQNYLEWTDVYCTNAISVVLPIGCSIIHVQNVVSPRHKSVADLDLRDSELDQAFDVYRSLVRK